MTRILILYYSMYGHIETMACAAEEAARTVAGVDVVVKRVPELMPADLALKAGVKLDQKAPIAEPKELADYDAILFGCPTRYGSAAAQMRNFIDQTGSLWMSGALIGKIASMFTSTATGGGNESTILTFIPTVLHLGMIYVGLPNSCPELVDITEVRGGSPYGAGTLAGTDGKRQPSEKELSMMRFQAIHVAQIARRLSR